MYQSLYVVDKDSGGYTAFQAEQDEVPWPVALLLGTFARKHLFERSRPANLCAVKSAVKDLTNRLKWAWIYRNSESKGAAPKLLKSSSVPTCTKVVDGVVSGFAIAASNVILNHISSANRAFVYALPAFVKWALRWIRSSKTEVRVSDKDGVFVLMNQATFADIKLQQVQKPCYRVVGTTTVEMRSERMVAVARSLATRLSNLGSPWAGEVHRHINRCTNDRAATLRSVLCAWSCTIKTHKEPGKVVARSIHSSVGNLWNALSMIVNKLLSPELKKLKHLCWSGVCAEIGA